MKVLLGILLLVNVALLMWGLGQRQFLNDSYSPATEYHPELMELLPPEKPRALAKVTINSDGNVTTTKNEVESGATADRTTVLPSSVLLGPLEEAAETSSSMMASVVPGQCMLIGPYKTEIERGRGGRKLNDMHIQYSDRQDPKGRVLGYRVFQGPFSSKKDVSYARLRLKKQGIKDLYLMNEGDNKRYISLGFFSSEKSANSFMDNFSKLRIKTNKRIEYGTNFWLLVTDLESIRKLIEKSSIPIQPGATKTIKSCTEIPW
ncbi:MAG: SPOR domain-containing protein [Arenicellales bacterium]